MYWREGVSVGPDDNFSVVRFRSPLFASPLPLRIRKAVLEGPMASPPSPFIPTHFTVNQACASASLRSGKEGGKPEPTKSSSLKQCCFCNAASSQNYKNICFFSRKELVFLKRENHENEPFFLCCVFNQRKTCQHKANVFLYNCIFICNFFEESLSLSHAIFFVRSSQPTQPGTDQAPRIRRMIRR